MYLTNGFTDPWEKSIAPEPNDLIMSQKTWSQIHSLREQFTMRFVELYAKHCSDKEVIQAYEEKCLVDKIITLFVGEEDKMRTSESKCIQFCEQHFDYEIPTLHGLLRPEHRPMQERIEEIDSLF